MSGTKDTAPGRDRPIGLAPHTRYLRSGNVAWFRRYGWPKVSTAVRPEATTLERPALVQTGTPLKKGTFWLGTDISGRRSFLLIGAFWIYGAF